MKMTRPVISARAARRIATATRRSRRVFTGPVPVTKKANRRKDIIRRLEDGKEAEPRH